MSIVAMVRCRDYEPAKVRAAVEEAFELAELDTGFAPGRKVLLKPNLLSARRPQDAVTTHPAVVTAAGEFCRSRGCEVAIGDSPPFAGEKAERYARLCEITGISAAARDADAALVRFEERTAHISRSEGRFYRAFEVASAVLEADVVVNIPKLKTHGLTKFTGAVKNVFGCIPGIRKGLFHVQAAEDRAVFAQMLVDLYGAIRPAVHLMDAVVGMDGEGPNAGNPRQIEALLASSDGVALDAVACAICGIDPMSVDTTRLAHEQNLGCADLGRVEIRGESLLVADFRLSSGVNEWLRVPRPIRRLLRRKLVAVPKIDAARCVGCGDCATACPAGAITAGKPAIVDLDRCIRCYCCHEVCNHSAAILCKGWLARLAGRAKKR